MPIAPRFLSLIPLFLSGLSACVFAEEAPLTHETLWRTIFQRPSEEEQKSLLHSSTEEDAEEAKRSLGELLFSETRLSGNRQRSCSSCHRKDLSFTDGLPTALGLKGEPLRRNTPHLWNLANTPAFFWDGREKSLQSQARVPLHSPQELSVNMSQTLEDFQQDPLLVEAFKRAFPQEPYISEDMIVEALASYEKSLLSPRTRFDAWVDGADEVLSEEEKTGFKIFVGKAGCVSCHGGWRFTDDQLHDIGLKSSDLGQGALRGANQGRPSFKTPGLRQVSHTAPYMHDGSLVTLEEVIQHYTTQRTLRPSLSPNIVRDLELKDEEKAALVAFLRTL